MNIRPIKTKADHEAALATLHELLEADPDLGSPAADEADILATLIERYESEEYPSTPPSPIEAIRFRMDQLGLTQKDLAPIIGSASKVSEVLSGKRSLSLNMIRSLHKNLGIAAEVLIAKEASPSFDEDAGAYPLKEMHSRGYFPGAPERFSTFKKHADKWLARLFDHGGVREVGPAYARSTAHYRTTKNIAPEAFLAWQARVLQRAKEQSAIAYRPGIIDEDFLKQVAGLSVLDDAPLLAVEFVEKHGVRVILEPHLPKTYLDGAAMLDRNGMPVIGLTLRHDRLDNFWFTLLHELVHVGWHLGGERLAFFDVLTEPHGDNDLEIEADQLAADALIDPKEWNTWTDKAETSPAAVREFALSIQRHPAVVAGRIRREAGDYRLLTSLVGGRQVRKLFP